MPDENGMELILFTLGAVLVLGPLAKHISRALKLPVSVIYLLLGLCLGNLWRPFNAFHSPAFTETFATIAQLGVIALLFRVGLRSHTSTLIEKLPQASLIWLSNVVGSFVVGFALSRFGFDWSFATSLVVGTAFTATSIVVSIAVWDELGLANSSTGATLLDVAELDDLSAAVLLAILLGTLPMLLNGETNLWTQIGVSTTIVILKLGLFIAGCYLFAHYVEARMTALNRRFSDTPASLTISILGAGLAIAAIAGLLGFSVAIGAMFAGLAFSRDPEAVRADGGFTYLYEFLTPFFFVHIGMQTDLSALLDVLGLASVLFMGAVAAKVLFTTLPAMRIMDRKQALNLGVSMVPRAEIALVVIYECRAIDPSLVSPELFAALVLVALATCISAPIVLRRMLEFSSETP